MIVPTRSRPEAVARVIDAWVATDAGFDGAELLFVVDADDPRRMEYGDALSERASWVHVMYADAWRPLVPKLNRIAVPLSAAPYAPALGFAGDDHLPRTYGWVRRYVDTLTAMGTGIVYGDDGYQHENLPTQWAMTADIVRALGRMVPARVDHLYCDNAIRDLGRAAGCLEYLPDVLIEHMHPAARDDAGRPKAPSDAQYERVNGREQYRGDKRAYREWQTHELSIDAAVVNDLRKRKEIPA